MHGYLRGTAAHIEQFHAVVNISGHRLETLLLRNKAIQTSSLQRTLQGRMRPLLGQTGAVKVRASGWSDQDSWEYAKKGTLLNLDLTKCQPTHLRLAQNANLHTCD
jgi:hypothetical protein